MSRWLRTLAMILAAVTVLVVTSDADAQRRRGRRARRGAESTEAQDPSAAEDEPSAADPGAPIEPVPTQSTTPQPTPPPPPTPPAAQTSAGSSTASGAATAAAPVEGDPGPMPPDLSALRQEYTSLMDEMVQARSRVSIVGQELFQSRMTITVQDRTGDEQTLTRFVLELDGTPVHRTDGEIEGGEQGRGLFEGALAPGPHVLTIDLEQRSRDDTEYRVTQRESFRFVVVRDRLTEITIVLEDDSDIAREFRSGGEGRFEIRTRVRVATRELPRS